ncbi:MAG: FAD-dependent oxidoreductase [Candidatus Hermodarchaeota archaeon]
METLDAIVVGAGPAGSAAAYSLAKAGLQVMLVERSKTPGEKNVSGGVLYGQVLHDLIPNYWEQAPVERRITAYRLSLLSQESAFTLDFSSGKRNPVPNDGYSLNRYKFDQWFAKQAENAGAFLASGIRVDDLLWEENRIIGIKAGTDEVHANVVIAADGVNSLLTEKAQLRRDHTPEQMGLGIKEVYKLPRETIEERFNLVGNEGAVYHFIGCTKGYPGGGFLYTNQDTLSLGLVIFLPAFGVAKDTAHDLMEHFKSYPFIQRLLRGGELKEYSAHLVPEGGYEGITKLFTNGFLVTGDAAGLAFNTGYALEGMNFAIASGIAAAETVIAATKTGDFSKSSLKRYEKLLRESFVLKDMKTFKRARNLLNNSRLHTTYPNLVNAFAADLFTPKVKPRQKLIQLLIRHVLGNVSIPSLIHDGLQAVRGL